MVFFKSFFSGLGLPHSPEGWTGRFLRPTFHIPWNFGLPPLQLGLPALLTHMGSPQSSIWVKGEIQIPKKPLSFKEIKN